LTYNSFGDWVPDNADETTSPDYPMGMEPEDFGPDNVLDGAMGPCDMEGSGSSDFEMMDPNSIR
jgi:hypothetical protein